MEFRWPLLLVILCSLLAGCQEPRSGSVFSVTGGERGIISGVPVGADDVAKESIVHILGPDTGAILGGRPDFSTCTGTLIADHIVLTAAHCVAPLKSQVSLFLAKILPDLGVISFASAPTEIRRITGFVVHENYQGQIWTKQARGYRPKVSADIALLYFEGQTPAEARAAQLNKGILNKELLAAPLELYGFGYERFDDLEVFSRDRDIQQGRDHYLTTQRLLMTSKKAVRGDGDGLILDQRRSAGICYGDSGGPTFIKREKQSILVAVHSHRTGLFIDKRGIESAENIQNDCQYESFVTRVDLYRDWIQDGIRKLSNPLTKESLPAFAEAYKERSRLTKVKGQELKSTPLRLLFDQLQRKTGSLSISTYRGKDSVDVLNEEFLIRWLSLDLGWMVSPQGWMLQEELFDGDPWQVLGEDLFQPSPYRLDVKFATISRKRSSEFRHEAWIADPAKKEIVVVREIVTSE